MKHIYLDKIKKYEAPPKILNIFSPKEINMMQELYTALPESVFNKKQNIRVPNHFPKIKPIIKVGNSIGDNSRFNITTIAKEIIVIKKILFVLYCKIKALFSLIN